MVETKQAEAVSWDDTLCVMVRGWTNRKERPRVLLTEEGGEFPDGFRKLVQETLPGADIIYPDLDMGLYSTADPYSLAEELLQAIDEAFRPERHSKVRIVAYSSGGPIARFALTKAFGVDDFGNVSQKRRAWAAKDVTVRVIYLAGTLHGWSVTTATPAGLRFSEPLTEAFVRAVCFLKSLEEPFIAHLRRNEPFIIDGRLRQLALRDASAPDDFPWQQIAFLGTQDEFISPNDCVELTHRSYSVFVETPATNHMEMLNVDVASADGEPEKEQVIIERRRLLTRGLIDDFDTLSADDDFVIHEDDINDYFDSLDRPRDLRQINGGAPNHATIILHGIRDNGFWTKRVARRLKENSTRPLLRAPSPSYGFFSMLDFVYKPARTKQTKWLMGQYADIRECYPQAHISFVGHSNGTYLAKRAMELCKSIKFKRIFFGGSVVRKDHDWLALRPQIEGEVLNLTGSDDMVIARLPGVMERFRFLRFLDVGGAGFDGFDQASRSDGWIKNWIYRGGHSDAVGEPNWGIIAHFIANGDMPDGDGAERTMDERRRGRGAVFFTLSRLLLGLVLICLTTWAISLMSTVLATLWVVLLAWVIWRVLRAY